MFSGCLSVSACVRAYVCICARNDYHDVIKIDGRNFTELWVMM